MFIAFYLFSSINDIIYIKIITNLKIKPMKKLLISAILVCGVIILIYGLPVGAEWINITPLLGGEEGDTFDLKSTLKVNSLKVGSPDIGGVTYLRGSIVNDTSTGSQDNPVTFGDNVRIDGSIYRGDTMGPGVGHPVYINDDARIFGNLTVNQTAQIAGDQSVGGNSTITGSETVAGNSIINGSVGIGTDSPIMKFHIYSNETDPPTSPSYAGQYIEHEPTFTQNFPALSVGQIITQRINITNNAAVVRALRASSLNLLRNQSTDVGTVTRLFGQTTTVGHQTGISSNADTGLSIGHMVYGVAQGGTITELDGFRYQYGGAGGQGASAEADKIVGFKSTDFNSINANNQSRIGLEIDDMPDPAAYTGTTVYAIDLLGTGGTRDGIRFAGDTNLYRSAADTLKTDDAFQASSLAIGTTTVVDSSSYILPTSSDEASAPNNSIFYSTDSTALVYKDSGGVSHALY